MVETNHPSYEYYGSILPFEKDFSPFDAKRWMEENFHLTFYFSIAYVIIIFSLKHLMMNKKPYSLSKLLAIWNAALAAFSIVAFIRVFPEWLFSFQRGSYYLVCSNSFLAENKISSLWSFLFILSKIPELGDTIFIVLRKQPLIFLHWYHHILTLIYVSYSFRDFASSTRTFVVMNTFVHSIMYSYYAFKAMKIHIPRTISVGITVLQIFQMVVGCYINYKLLSYIAQGKRCGTTLTNAFISSVMYLSYFYLFARFFYLSYCLRKPRKKMCKRE